MNTRRATTPAELEAAIAKLPTRNPRVREAMAELIRAGRLVDSGLRRNGQIVWVTPEHLPH
jgi:hypothetical protein